MNRVLVSISMMVGLMSAIAIGAEVPSLPGKGLDPVTVDEVQPIVRICEGCHGINGQSTRDDVPVIAGKPADYIMNSLEQFYFYERGCPDVQTTDSHGDAIRKSMCDIVNTLNKQEALALAQYFSGQ